MRAYIACGEADEAVAEALQAYLVPHGLFAEVETGAKGFRHLQASDVVIALWSRSSVFTVYRMQMEKRMLDAWAEERLILVKLDNHFLPVGMRDLPAIDGSFESARPMTVWPAVAREAKERINALLVARQQEQKKAGDERERRSAEPPTAIAVPPGSSDIFGEDGVYGGRGSDILSAPSPQAPGAPKYEPMAKSGGGGLGLLVFLLLLIGLPLAAYFLGGFKWLAARMDVEAFAGLVSSPLFLAVAGGTIGLIVFASIMVGLMRRPRVKGWAGAPPAGAEAWPDLESAALSEEETEPEGGVLFVSYAHADNNEVEPLVTVVRSSGREVWIDKGGIQAGTGWAGEIVRAIKASGGIMVMCSSRAFQSDHVKREIYLADRYKKPMLPVFLEEASPPEDFEFFFAGVQWLELFKLPETERAGAVERALAFAG